MTLYGFAGVHSSFCVAEHAAGVPASDRGGKISEARMLTARMPTMISSEVPVVIEMWKMPWSSIFAPMKVNSTAKPVFR